MPDFDTENIKTITERRLMSENTDLDECAMADLMESFFDAVDEGMAF